MIPSPDAALGDGDGAARHPYQKPDGAAMVGTPRCGVPARQGGTKGCERPHVCAVPLPSPDAALGDGDGAARHPYQNLDGAAQW
jgi:hypothetical protein